MFEKNLKMTYLLDFYGDVLDGHTKDVMSAYYDDDLSLGEIASDEGISRQGIRHIIKRGEEQLTFLEEKLGLAQRHERLRELASELDTVRVKLANMHDTEGEALVAKVVEEIINKGS